MTQRSLTGVGLAGLLVLALLTPGVAPIDGLRTSGGRLASGNGGAGLSPSPTANPEANRPLAQAPTPGGIAQPSPTVTTPSPSASARQPAAPPTVAPRPTAPPTAPPKPPPPPPSGWPGPGNTGVPAGTILTPHAGNVVVTQAGAVIDALDITNGCIDIQAPNVTIKRTRIRSSTACSSQALIQDGYTNSGVLIQDTEIDGLGSQVTGVGNSGMTLLRVNIHGIGAGIHIDGDYVTVRDSWVHDLREVSGSHNDTVYTSGSNHVIIRHNTLENPLNQTSVIIISAWSDPVTDWQVDTNLFNGGGYTIYGGEGGSFPVSNIRYTNNRFGHKFHALCGSYGPVTYWNSGAAGSVWSGNVWEDTGLPIEP